MYYSFFNYQAMNIDKFGEDLSPKSAEYQRAIDAGAEPWLLECISECSLDDILVLQHAIEGSQCQDSPCTPDCVKNLLTCLGFTQRFKQLAAELETYDKNQLKAIVNFLVSLLPQPKRKSLFCEL